MRFDADAVALGPLGDDRAAALVRRRAAPSARSTSSAAVTVDRLTASSSASRRSGGSCVPGARSAGVDQPAQAVGEALAQVAVALVGPASQGGGDWPAIGLFIHMPIMPTWTVTSKANGRTMEAMFAPYCATCGLARLLTVSRIVATDWERGGAMHVRCTCGTIIDADARPPTSEASLPRAS